MQPTRGLGSSPTGRGKAQDFIFDKPAGLIAEPPRCSHAPTPIARAAPGSLFDHSPLSPSTRAPTLGIRAGSPFSPGPPRRSPAPCTPLLHATKDGFPRSHAGRRHKTRSSSGPIRLRDGWPVCPPLIRQKVSPATTPAFRVAADAGAIRTRRLGCEFHYTSGGRSAILNGDLDATTAPARPPLRRSRDTDSSRVPTQSAIWAVSKGVLRVLGPRRPALW